jgi:hypothetical protein
MFLIITIVIITLEIGEIGIWRERILNTNT